MIPPGESEFFFVEIISKIEIPLSTEVKLLREKTGSHLRITYHIHENDVINAMS